MKTEQNMVNISGADQITEYINLFADTLSDFAGSYFKAARDATLPDIRHESVKKLSGGSLSNNAGESYYGMEPGDNLQMNAANPNSGKSLNKTNNKSGTEYFSENRERLRKLSGTNENKFGYDNLHFPSSANNTLFPDTLNEKSYNTVTNNQNIFFNQTESGSIVESFNAEDITRTKPYLTGLNNAGMQATPGNVDGYRQLGGLAEPFKKYVVGENGPEILNMGSESGSIIPNNASAGNPASAITINNNVTVNVEGGAVDGSFSDKLKKALDDISLTEFRAKAGLS